MTSLFFFNSRFRLPLLPLYIILSSYTLSVLSEKLFTNRKQAFILLSIIFIVGLISFYPVVETPKRKQLVHIISQGINLHSLGYNDLALETFKKAAKTDSTFPEVNLNIGICFFKKGIEDSALYYFNKEKNYNPLRSKAYTNIASIYLLNKKHNSALIELEQPLNKTPHDIVANQIYLRSIILSNQYVITEIERIIYEAARKTDDNIYILNQAATLLNDKKEYKLSEKILFKALLSSPPPIETDDLAFQRNFENSIIRWEKEKSKTYYLLGFIKGLHQAYGQSIEFSNKAIALDSSMAEAYVNLISAYLSTNQPDTALSILSYCKTRFPDNYYFDRLEKTF